MNPRRRCLAALRFALLATLLPAGVTGCHAGMVRIPGGEFQLGSPDPVSPTNEMPMHPNTLKSYWLGIHEVTNGEFHEFLVATGYRPDDSQGFLEHWGAAAPPPELAAHPVVYVSLRDAEAYCEWAGRRLPTEAEWERAATWDADTARKALFPWGDDEDPSRAQVQAQGTAAVGAHPEGNSPDGIADLYGNVWEWTSSWYGPYPENLDEDPDYGETKRVVRGVSFHPDEIRLGCTTRNPQPPGTRSPLIGFRVAD